MRTDGAVVGARDAGAGEAGATDGGSASCPSAWGSLRRLLASPRASASTCACSCGVGPNPCHHDSVSLSYRTGNTYCNDGASTLLADGVCRAMPAAWPTGTNGANGTALGVKSAACPATATLPGVADDGAIEVCVPTSPLPSPTPAAPGSVCFLGTGDRACPDIAPAKKTLVPQDEIIDTRSCGACTCTTTATSCSSASVTFASDATCASGARTVTIDGNCNSISGSGGSPAYYKYTATPNTLACSPASTTSNVNGALTLPGPVTLCCP